MFLETLLFGHVFVKTSNSYVESINFVKFCDTLERTRVALSGCEGNAGMVVGRGENRLQSTRIIDTSCRYVHIWDRSAILRDEPLVYLHTAAQLVQVFIEESSKIIYYLTLYVESS